MADVVWHYRQDDGTRGGPVSQDELCDMFRTGELTAAHTEVKSSALPEWVPATKIPALRALRAAPLPLPVPLPQPPPAQPAPPVNAAPIPTAPTVPVVTLSPSLDYAAPATDGESGVPQVRPWVRYWARSIDSLMSFVAVVAMAVFFALGFRSLSAPAFREPGLLGSLLFNALGSLVAIVVEAFQMSAFGTTIGKALLGVVVRNEDGSRLTFEQALRRAFGVGFRGMGFGVVPVVTLIAMGVAYAGLTSEGVTTWDRRGGFRVTHRRVGLFRGVLAGGVLLAPVLLVFAAVAVAVASGARTSRAVAVRPPAGRVNSVTATGTLNPLDRLPAIGPAIARANGAKGPVAAAKLPPLPAGPVKVQAVRMRPPPNKPGYGGDSSDRGTSGGGEKLAVFPSSTRRPATTQPSGGRPGQIVITSTNTNTARRNKN